MKAIILEQGKQFGRLNVIKQYYKNNKFVTKCVCDCGVEKEFLAYNLKSGRSKSCGCLKKKLATERSRTHNLYGTKIYIVWANMLQRCTNIKNKSYIDYGGRGIKICKRWHKFENFYKDMGERPKKKSLDRINNDGNYCKENCRWATREEQQNNTRKNRILNLDGSIITIAQASKLFKIPASTLYSIARRTGMKAVNKYIKDNLVKNTNENNARIKRTTRPKKQNVSTKIRVWVCDRI